MIVDRAIIGAGFAGLLEAYEALGRGERVTLIEASPRIGGVLQPITIGDSVIDGGAEAFSTVEPHVSALAQQLGLGDAIVIPSGLPARIIGPSTTTTIPEGVFGIPRTLDDPTVSQAVGRDAVEKARSKDRQPLPAHWASLSVGDMVRERLGDTFLTHLVEPVIGGVHGVGADRLDAMVVLPQVVREAMACGSLVEAVDRVRQSRLAPGSAVATIEGGLFQLTTRLAELVGERRGELLTGTRANSLISEGDTWAIDTPSGLITARRVTLACGPAAQTDLLRQAFHRSVTPPGRATDSRVVIAHVHSTMLSGFPLGSGALVSPQRHDTIRATTHINAKWPHIRATLPEDTHLIRFSTNAATPSALTVDEIVQSGLDELYGVHDWSVSDTIRLSWPGSLLTPHRGHRAWVTSNAPVWEEKGITLRGALMTGNGLLGITHSHEKRDAA